VLTALRTILRDAAKALGVERAAHAALIEEMWAELVGREAAEHSRLRGLRGGVLLVDAEAGPWAQELSARRAAFAAGINRRLGTPAVTDIRVRQVAGLVMRPPAAPGEGRAESSREPEGDLTAEEIAAVERAVAEIGDAEIRAAARRAMLSQARWRKRHVRASGR